MTERGEWTLIVRGISHELARELAERVGGGSMMWHGGIAYPFSDSTLPCEITRRAIPVGGKHD